MLLLGSKAASFPPNPILAHWNGLERNGTLEHPAVPPAGTGPPGPPQPSAVAPIDSQRPCGSNPQVAAPSARRLRSPPDLTPLLEHWNRLEHSVCQRVFQNAKPEIA